jgi:fermentation-respiration switch protein FrsA (DUF1100 family)
MVGGERVRRGARVFGRGVAVVFVVWVGVVMGMWGLENFLVFQPSPYSAANLNWRAAGTEFEDVEIASSDGVTLNAWYAAQDSPRAVVLLLHGNGGNISMMGDELRALERMGAAALAVDYRGYGKSTGSPNEAGVLADARAARKWLAERTGVAERDVVLWGFSMGGGVAVDLAARDGARGLVLQSTFTSLPDAAAVHYPWLPVRWMMRNRLDSAAKIAQYAGPLLQSHGTADSVVPYALGEQLFALAKGPKRFLAIDGGEHNNPPGGEFYDALAEFIGELPAKGAK